MLLPPTKKSLPCGSPPSFHQFHVAKMQLPLGGLCAWLPCVGRTAGERSLRLAEVGDFRDPPVTQCRGAPSHIDTSKDQT